MLTPCLQCPQLGYKYLFLSTEDWLSFLLEVSMGINVIATAAFWVLLVWLLNHDSGAKTLSEAAARDGGGLAQSDVLSNSTDNTALPAYCKCSKCDKAFPGVSRSMPLSCC